MCVDVVRVFDGDEPPVFAKSRLRSERVFLALMTVLGF